MTCSNMIYMKIYSKKIKKIKNGDRKPVWPIVILKTPKGWTGPKEVDGKEIENSFRAHQVPDLVFQVLHDLTLPQEKKIV